MDVAIQLLQDFNWDQIICIKYIFAKKLVQV